MEEVLTLLVSQGPLGMVAALFIGLYLQERKRNTDQTTGQAAELARIREVHYDKLDTIRQSQISREQEVAKTLEEYGRGVVEAIDRTAFLAQELRRTQVSPDVIKRDR